MSPVKWWKGRRGEWYVVAQAALLMLVFLGPATWPDVPPWTSPYDWLGRLLGSFLMVAGVGLSVIATLHLGRNLTPLPHPKEDGELTVNGAYRLVRHPIYSGLILTSFGWGLWVNGWFTIAYAMILFIFFDIKSRREEAWLMEKYSDYREYRQRVRKLILFIY